MRSRKAPRDTACITGVGKNKCDGIEGSQAVRPAGKCRLEAGWAW